MLFKVANNLYILKKNTPVKTAQGASSQTAFIFHYLEKFCGPALCIWTKPHAVMFAYRKPAPHEIISLFDFSGVDWVNEGKTVITSETKEYALEWETAWSIYS